jgi:hypothetical protein
LRWFGFIDGKFSPTPYDPVWYYERTRN